MFKIEVYHYCKRETFESIIKSKTLWLTNLKKSNDEEELKRAYDILWLRVKEILGDGISGSDLLQKTIENLDNHLHLQFIADDLFGCCFCAESDLYQQWLEYGDQGRGFALGFDLEWFPGLQKQFPTTSGNINNAIGYERVIYDTKEAGLEDEMASIILQALNMNGAIGWLDGGLSTFKRYAAFIKNPTFKDERETRIAYYPDELIEELIPGLSVLINEPIPHYTLDWASNISSALKTIVIGFNNDLSINDVERILYENGIKNEIKIVQSECSYKLRGDMGKVENECLNNTFNKH